MKQKQVHIKALEYQKCFNGHIYNRSYGNSTVQPFGDDLKILASEVVNFEVEFRSYILNGKIIGTEADRPEEKAFVEKLIRNYRNAPVAYAIDCGWMVPKGYDSYEDKPHYKVGKLAIVETNEGFSAGSMGTNVISHKNYAKLTEARWKEIVNS